MRALSRRLTILSLVASLALSTAGCVPKIGRAATPEPVILRFAYRQHTVQLDTLFQAFHEKYPSITIEPIEAERWGNQIESFVEMGNVDILMEGRSALGLANRGLILPLDEIQLGDWADIRDDYVKGAWEGLSIAGQQLGIPAGIDMLVVYINLDQARALKAQVPETDWTLFDLVDLAMAMNFPEGLPHAQSARLFGFCTTPQDIDPVVFVYLHGGTIVDDLNDPSLPTLDDPATIEAAQWYVDLFTNYQVSPNPDLVRQTYRRGGVYEAAVRGHCGVWLGWFSNRDGLDMPFEWSMDWKMLPLPKDRVSVGLGDVVGYYITKSCRYPKEALKLLRFLADHWEASGTKLPPRRSLIKSKEYETDVGEDIVKVAMARADRLLMLPAENTQALEQVGIEYLNAIRAAIAEDLDPAGMLAEAQDRVKNVFRQP